MNIRKELYLVLGTYFLSDSFILIYSLPWFSVHIVLLNDPGSLLSVHLMHTSVLSGWAGLMLGYEVLIFDPSDLVCNPTWSQSVYTLATSASLGTVDSLSGWSLTSSLDERVTLESVIVLHLTFALGSFLASSWHWVYWNLHLFDLRYNLSTLNLISLLGVHLLIASILCFLFGSEHLSSAFGPGVWTSDTFGLSGSIRSIKPWFSLLSLSVLDPSSIPSHHIAWGLLGSLASIWKLYSNTSNSIALFLGTCSIEATLASSIVSALLTVLTTSGLMWYGSATTPVELFGPSSYSWDTGYFSLAIEEWTESPLNGINVPDKIVVYDYLGSVPSNGGLFSSGPLNLGEGLIQSWSGSPLFWVNSTLLSVSRMPAFFETFPVILVDSNGVVSADIPFNRSDSVYSIEQMRIFVYFQGGVFDNSLLKSPGLVNNYASNAQLGQVLLFDNTTWSPDGVFSSSLSSWHTFAHTSLAALFIFGHLWHASSALYSKIWLGISGNLSQLVGVEYGSNEKLGGFSKFI